MKFKSPDSNPWVKSSYQCLQSHDLRVRLCKLRVQIQELRVYMHKLRLQIHELRAQIHKLHVQIHEFKNHLINENSSKQPWKFLIS